MDKDGNFYKVIILNDGKNVISVEAKAPFKSTTQLNTTVIRTEDESGISGERTMNQTPEVQY